MPLFPVEPFSHSSFHYPPLRMSAPAGENRLQSLSSAPNTTLVKSDASDSAWDLRARTVVICGWPMRLGTRAIEVAVVARARLFVLQREPRRTRVYSRLEDFKILADITQLILCCLSFLPRLGP